MKAKGLTIWPVTYGRAKVLAGIVKAKPRGARTTKASSATTDPTRLAPARMSGRVVGRRPPTEGHAPVSMMGALARIAADVAVTLRDGLIDVLRGASFSDIATLVGRGVDVMGDDDGARSAPPAKRAPRQTAKPRASRGGERRDPAEMQKVRDGIVKTLRGAKRPMRSGEIAAAIGQTGSGQLILPLARLRKAP